MKIKITDILLMLLSGVLTALAFPKFSLSFLCWIALIPFFFVISRKTPKQSFVLGLIAGFAYYAVLLYWIPDVPAHYGDLSIGFSILIFFVFMLYLSLFWAFFALVFTKIRRLFPKAAFFLAPVLWVAFEYILTHLLTGFPWGLLGYAQYQNLYFIQLTSLTGVYGLSFAIVLLQSLFVLSMLSRKKFFFLAGLALVFAVHLGGFLSLKPALSPRENTFQASVIQGNVSSDIYWDKITAEEIQRLFQRHLDLTNQAHSEGARLIIWPEFSVPLCFSCSYSIYPDFKERLFHLVEQTGSTLLLGTNETKRTMEANEYYNTALCLSPDLTYTEYYKMHLVPFGEYTPYKNIFSFINTMTHAIGDISPGKAHVLHEFDGIKFGSPICYEIIFPDLVRKFVWNGANFLTTITNDGWYGMSSAPYQHFAIAVLRAVENRRFLLRAATTGVSGIIDPYGRVLAKSEMETLTTLTEQITPLSRRTLYTVIGDAFAYICLTLSGLFLILVLVVRKK
ncbi:MAG: apolipoprotein N-acyltransferase [Candidatus Aminicenantes bacterium]